MVRSLRDPRGKVYATDCTIGAWGHPQTRLGILAATGELFVRMNDDNRPSRHYLETLAAGFESGSGIVYARVVYKGDARRVHYDSMGRSFVIPRDVSGSLKLGNVDYMNYMVDMNVAKKYVDSWGDAFAADWDFLAALLSKGIKAKFIDRIIGEKW